MPAVSCMDQAIKLAKGRLTPEEVADAFDQEQKIRAKVIEKGYANVDEMVARRIVDVTFNKKLKAARNRRRAALNFIARRELDIDLPALEAQGISPAKALRATMDGIQGGPKGGVMAGRKSVYAQSQAFETRFLGEPIFARIAGEKPHIEKMLQDKPFNDAVQRELYELRPDGTPGITKNKDAEWFAKVLASAMEISRKDMNKYGANIGKLDGYMGVQTHDDLKMRKMGENDWVKFIRPLIDFERTFPDMTTEEADKALHGVYRTIITDIDHKNPALSGSRVSKSNLASKLSMERKLHFADADAAIKYNDELGRGLAVNNIFSSQRYAAKLTAAMQRFGPNPEVMVDAIAARRQLQLKDAIASADAKTQKKLLSWIDELDKDRLESTVNMMTGLASSPVNSRMSEVNNNIRAVLAMAKLGAAFLTAMPSDTMTAAVASWFRGRGFWTGLIDHVGGVAGQFTSPKARQFGFLLGEGFDGIMGYMSAASLAHDGAPGGLSKMSQLFFKLNGLTGWTDASRAAASRVIVAHLGSEAGNSWAKLNPDLRHVLGMNGIDDVRWEAMRKMAAKGDNGSMYLTPDGIRKISRDDIIPVVQRKIDQATTDAKLAGKKGADLEAAKARLEAKVNKIIEDGKTDLEMDLLRYIADEVNYSIVEVDAKSRRYSTVGTRPGTVAGEAIRYIMQFKGFPIAFSERILGRAIKGQRGATVAQRRLQAAGHLGTVIVGMTVAGYMSNMMKDAAKGLWPPRDPFKPSTITDAMLSGGGMGIYGDFLLGRASTFGNTAIETAAGPAVTTAGQALALFYQAREGNAKAGKALDLAISNTPFANLFYTRPVLDYLILNEMREWASPGYLARRNKARRNRYGQEYLLPERVSQ